MGFVLGQSLEVSAAVLWVFGGYDFLYFLVLQVHHLLQLKVVAQLIVVLIKILFRLVNYMLIHGLLSVHLHLDPLFFLLNRKLQVLLLLPRFLLLYLFFRQSDPRQDVVIALFVDAELLVVQSLVQMFVGVVIDFL